VPGEARTAPLLRFSQRRQSCQLARPTVPPNRVYFCFRLLFGFGPFTLHLAVPSCPFLQGHSLHSYPWRDFNPLAKCAARRTGVGVPPVILPNQNGVGDRGNLHLLLRRKALMLPSIPKGRPKPLQIDLGPDTKSNHHRHSYDSFVLAPEYERSPCDDGSLVRMDSSAPGWKPCFRSWVPLFSPSYEVSETPNEPPSKTSVSNLGHFMASSHKVAPGIRRTFPDSADLPKSIRFSTRRPNS
jgi:hypothetical protein